MMHKNLLVYLFSLLVLFTVACKEKQSTEVKKESSVSDTKGLPELISIKQENLFPEGVSYDSSANRFFITSLHKGVITEVKPDGSTKVFVNDEKLISVIGIKTDIARDRLIVCNSDPGASVKTKQETQKKIAGLGVYQLSTGTKISYVDLAALNPKDVQFCNDMVIDDKGNIYVSNSFAPVIYKVNLEYKPEILLRNEKFSGEGFNLNGLVYHNNGYIIIAKYNEGSLFKIPVDKPDTFTEVKLPQKLIGADGLLWMEEGKLLVIANSGTNKVFLLSSTDDWTSAKIEKEMATADVFPTTATRAGKEYFYLSAKLDKLFSGKLPVAEFEINKIKF
ncbi:MAG: hypothetical protein H7A25_11200 [Leptospiraceae bacterium]|nr:hypothetical protein [Leptospiraceae bacterium]